MATPGKILVVEDKLLNRILIVDILKLNGYEVLEAETGEDALRVLKNHKPDLILMDLQLPLMDGFTALKHIRAIPDLKDIPIVAVTASAMNGDEEDVISKGFNGYISKPIDTKKFPLQIKSFLGE